MTIRRGQELEEKISYFQSYTPPPSPPDTVPVSFLNDMVSYNIKPNQTVLLKYQVGAENTYSFAFTIKNITTNIKISVAIPAKGFWTTDLYEFTLNPLQQRTAVLSINKDKLNNSAGIVDLFSDINIRVINEASETQALQNTATPLIGEFALPNPIRVS